MQSHLLVEPISIAAYGSAADSTFISAAPPFLLRHQRHPLIAAAFSFSSSSSFSSASAINGGGDHYTVLGVARIANVAEIKRAYRLLARKNLRWHENSRTEWLDKMFFST